MRVLRPLWGRGESFGGFLSLFFFFLFPSWLRYIFSISKQSFRCLSLDRSIASYISYLVVFI